MKATFGKYAIIDPVKHVFEQEPAWYWMIKPPDAAAELAVARVLVTDRSRLETDGTRVSEVTTTLEIAIKEVAVTFGGTNIPISETDPTPMIAEGASLAAVEAVVSRMPRAMVIEIWNAVGNACPGWGPAKPRAARQPGDEAKN